jgi:replicative DNA helicase
VNHRDASETTLGLIIQGRLSPNTVRPDIFYGETKKAIKLIKSGIVQTEELIEKCGLPVIQASLEAAKSLNGLGDSDWPTILEHKFSNHQAGIQFERMGKQLQKGEDVDWTKVKELITNGQQDKTNMLPMSQIDGGQTPFINTGWKPIDEHLGGFPETGMVLIGGSPGSGKTRIMEKLAKTFVKTHPDKNVALFSLEMLKEELVGRIRNEGDKITKEQEDRIIICDESLSAEQISNKASTIDNLGMVVTDFADMLIWGDTTESAMAQIYRVYARTAKQLHIPNVLLCQLNRTYQGGIPRPNQLRYTGMAEALAWMVLMVYNPNIDYFKDEDEATKELVVTDSTAYLCAWKVRGGFRKHLEDSPGAILIPFKREHGWGNNSKWFSLKSYI